MLATLRQRNFALLWFGGLISMVGNWVLIAALPYYIYQQTGSALASSAILIAYTLPFLLLGSVAGVFVDRWNRKRTIVVANLMQAALMLLLLLVRSNEWLWLAYVVAFVESSISTFSGPAESALLPRLVGQEHLLPANSLNSLNDNLARMIGPPIGGALIGWLGLNSVVLLDSASYLIAGALIACISTTQEPVRESGEFAHTAGARWAAFWHEWREGLRFVRRDQLIAALFVVVAIQTFGDSILSALLVPFVDHVLRAGALGFGWLLTARGVGGLIGGVIIGQVGQFVRPAHLLGLSSLLSGALLLILFNFPAFPLALALVGLVGVTAIGFMVSQQTLLQSNVPEQYLGRVFGAYGTTGALLGLGGTIVGGTLGGKAGIVPMLDVSGGLTILAGIVALTFIRSKLPNELGQRIHRETSGI